MTVPVLRTSDLMLRPLELRDASAITDALADWDVSQWLSAVPYPYSTEDAEYFITKIAPNDTIWAIDDGTGLIGVIGVKPDLGYWLRKELHGKGYMTQAADAAIAWYFSQAEADLPSGHFPDNIGSRAVLIKMGFTDTNLGRVLQTSTGKEVALQHMVLSRAAWLARLRAVTSSNIPKPMHNLTYRPMLPADAVALHQIVSNWSVVRQLGGWPWPASKAFTFGRCVPYAGDDGFIWAICRDGTLCGSIAITNGHIGYMLDPAVHGQGVMTQAATNAIDAYFATGAERLDADSWHDNLASQRVLEKLGFVHWSTRYEKAKARQLPTLSHQLRLSRDTWHGLRTAAQ